MAYTKEDCCTADVVNAFLDALQERREVAGSGSFTNVTAGVDQVTAGAIRAMQDWIIAHCQFFSPATDAIPYSSSVAYRTYAWLTSDPGADPPTVDFGDAAGLP
jgi:hypothetical protein